jgi:hypothetical protein
VLGEGIIDWKADQFLYPQCRRHSGMQAIVMNEIARLWKKLKKLIRTLRPSHPTAGSACSE